MSRGILLDTNVPSELIRLRAEPRVERWLESQAERTLFLSVATIGELRKGMSLLVPGKRRTAFEHWLNQRIIPRFAGRILPIDRNVALRWGDLTAKRQQAGKPLGVMDGLIAATAFEHDLTLATRNVADMEGLGVDLLNPWELSL